MKGECGCSGSSSCKSNPPHYHHHNYPAYHHPTNSYPASIHSEPSKVHVSLSRHHICEMSIKFHHLKTLEANHYIPFIGNCGSDCSCSSCK